MTKRKSDYERSKISTASIFIHVRLCSIMLNVRSNRLLKKKNKNTHDDQSLTDNCHTNFVFLSCLQSISLDPQTNAKRSMKAKLSERQSTNASVV